MQEKARRQDEWLIEGGNVQQMISMHTRSHNGWYLMVGTQQNITLRVASFLLGQFLSLLF